VAISITASTLSSATSVIQESICAAKTFGLNFRKTRSPLLDNNIGLHLLPQRFAGGIAVPPNSSA
jgi:hypothetical protein